MTERCYRLADHTDTVDVRGDEARDALLSQGYGVVAPIDCVSGTITSQADQEHVEQGIQEREFAASLPEDEMRQLRRVVGSVQLASAAPSHDVDWKG